MYGLVQRVGGTVGRICALVGALARRGGRCVVASCTIRIAAAPFQTDDLGLPEVIGVDGVEPAHETALRIALLRLVIQHHHDLAGDVHAGEVVVLILGCGNAVSANTTGRRPRRRRFPAAPS